jgi:signal peptidase I
VPRITPYRVLVVLTIIVLVFVFWFVRPFRIPTSSMVPTFRPGDQVLAARVYELSDPQRGDLIVFHPNGKGARVYPSNTVSSETFVKRLIGMPGETIGSHAGRVYVCQKGARAPISSAPDQTPGCRYLHEPYVHGQATGPCGAAGGDFGPIVVQPSSYYFLGDNRLGSDDSRCFGQVPSGQVIGRVFFTYWPPSRWGIP